jgi:hypothetical protein
LDGLPALSPCVDRGSPNIGLLHPNHKLLRHRLPDELVKTLKKKRTQITQLASPCRMVHHDQEASVPQRDWPGVSGNLITHDLPPLAKNSLHCTRTRIDAHAGQKPPKRSIERTRFGVTVIVVIVHAGHYAIRTGIIT